MKQLGLLLLVLLLPVTFVTAQDCAGYYFLQQNKVITMTTFDRKEQATGTYVYRVSDVAYGGEHWNAVVNGELTDEKGKLLSRNTCRMICAKGLYLVDMKLLLPQQQQEQFKNMETHTDFYLEYPSRMVVGEQLKDGNFNAVMKNDKGPELTVEMTITDRKVLAEEVVNTPAGSWRCFRITSRCKVRTRVGGVGIPFQIDNTEWFAPAFGIVKTASKWGSTMITAIQ